MLPLSVPEAMLRAQGSGSAHVAASMAHGFTKRQHDCRTPSDNSAFSRFLVKKAVQSFRLKP